MAFIDGDNGQRRWVSERGRISDIRDNLRAAAEQFAQDVETYLYDQHSDLWMKPEFLAWAIARYDVAKTGSGNYAQMNTEFNHQDAVLQPVPPPSQKPNPKLKQDIAVRYPEHAREAKHINTEKK